MVASLFTLMAATYLRLRHAARSQSHRVVTTNYFHTIGTVICKVNVAHTLMQS